MRCLPLLLFAVSLNAQEYRAFWADAFHKGYKTPIEVDQMVADVVAAKSNAIFIEVRHRGGSYFLQSLEPPVEDNEYSKGFDALQYLIEKAHARGIEVHAWFPVTPFWPFTQAPVDPRHAWFTHGPNAKGDDMWMTMTASGKKSTSIDPGNAGAMRYLADVVTDPLKHYDIDGIHLDYIRYPEDDNYGWNPAAIARFQRLMNRTGNPVAMDPRWSDFRRRQVTQLTRQIYLRAIALKPKTKVSAALVTWGNGPLSDAAFLQTDAYGRVFQDWRSWMEEGILDLAIPMNYFRDSSNASFLDRWMEFEKNHQFRRGLLVGLAPYLNSIPDSVAQLKRVRAASAAGNKALGVNFYSYASTNVLNSAGAPITPNTEFYKAVADVFGATATVPDLPWKTKPDRGHIYGWVTVDDGAVWLKDGATVRVESDTGKPFTATTVTDGTGFFGSVNLQPDRYRLVVERGGVEIFRAAAKDVKAGETTRFDLILTASHFADATPMIASFDGKTAAPGDVITLFGSGFTATSAWSRAVPLAVELSETQVLVNGTAAPLFRVEADQITLQIPYQAAPSFTIMVRRDGVESALFRIDAQTAAPVIKAAVRSFGTCVEIYATGLGAVRPAISAGNGADPVSLPVVVATTTVLLSTPQGEVHARPFYAGLTPYQPGLYQVNFCGPELAGATAVRLDVGGIVSEANSF